VAVSLALSAASYYGVERPMIRLRRQFGSHAVADGGGRMAVPVESQPAPGFP
jgi:peptidoglycan/LPS O-acetylase OafA/YrhL